MKNLILGIENLYLGALFDGILIFEKILNWKVQILDFGFLCYFLAAFWDSKIWFFWNQKIFYKNVSNHKSNLWNPSQFDSSEQVSIIVYMIFWRFE